MVAKAPSLAAGTAPSPSGAGAPTVSSAGSGSGASAPSGACRHEMSNVYDSPAPQACPRTVLRTRISWSGASSTGFGRYEFVNVAVCEATSGASSAGMPSSSTAHTMVEDTPRVPSPLSVSATATR